MSRLPESLARALARPRAVGAAAGAALLLAVAVAAVAVTDGRDDALSTARSDVDASRVAPPTTSTTTTTSAVAPTTIAPTAAPTTTAAVPPTTAAPPPTDPPPVATTAAPPPPPQAAPASPPSGSRCLVRLHGKGGGGSPTAFDGDVVVLSPGGNADGWGGRQWSYAGGSYDAARGAVAQAVDGAGCGQVIVDGFSNGGAFAVKLYCRGESFGGRLVGVVADDPVPDHGADRCVPAADVPLTIYWTGALAATATPGWDCAQQDWTCEGGTTVGIDAYVANAGASLRQSPFQGHQWYADAPETTAWRW
jgi:hypothetical protein